ncbi:mandelate racemase/muconate lactonizing enzyme family protein [Fibrisoma montanum]|uniref:Mandelate racemase/muconate lactonizing enzyme family protein n=1 Tax=Fibrisoma montanum TaxID=2305895 RepID=A0A418MAX4_9BACT|nr:mandelate racemase/muconate lactonizing enzyme family protein [Fibrisoma montanum]RIV23514.1 mandelate racemase/muconate lactonizing enzyme family protein [Fibrisoma montanum]
MNRLTFLQTLVGTAALGLTGATPRLSATLEPLPTWPLPDLKKAMLGPVMIRSVELLKTQNRMLLVVTAEDGAKGITQCNDRMPNLTSLLKGLVLPHFVGKDARDLPQLVDNAYRLNSNYKYAGMPLWNCIGSVEIATWDLLGQLTRKPVYALLGKPVRTEYDVYISDFYRGGEPPEKVVDRLAEKLAATGANGIKIKVGGRMLNTPEDDRRTRQFVPLVRKKLGDAAIIYADGNGSFSPKEGIETGKFLESYGVAIFEEPCSFEDEEGMRSVNQALSKIMLAGGEQDSSLYRFERLSRTGVYDLYQPDLYYNGGILRTLQVSRIVGQYGKQFAPHTPKADPLIAPFWQVAALAPNLYGLQEFVYNPGDNPASWYSPDIRVNNGKMAIPDTPGLGIRYDDGIWKGAERIV